ncbi:cyclic peptide export ABC transporter [Bradyrhizobium sp. HKCCYLRH3095]|uniref:cyclic peptide export ABC transporter n=1 Tax=unclassified Bradyrhizobium TaxID=2631580 RepID=UPI003EB9FF55
MMFLNLLRQEMGGSFYQLLIMAGLAGLSNAAVLATVNAAAQASKNGKPGAALGVLFVASLLLFMVAGRYLLLGAVGQIEALIHRLRLRLIGYVRQSELLKLEEIGRPQIYAAIVEQTDALRQATSSLAFATQGAILIVFVALYIAWMSLTAFALSAAVIGLASAVYFIRSRDLAGRLKAAAESNDRLFQRVTDLLDGFKEVRLNSSRSTDLYDDFVEVSRTAANLRIRTQAETFKRLLLSQTFMYVLLGVIVFVVPALSTVSEGALSKTTMAVLFVIGACFGLVQAVPVMQTAGVAADGFEKLEARLQAFAAEDKVCEQEAEPTFATIEVRDVHFHYQDRKLDKPFQIGPVDFTLRRGELIYITGGNGSGKSTFLQVLAGLYAPDTGEITLDGVRVTDDNRNAYRALFAAVFADYHLFDRLYGVPEPPAGEVERQLARFQLTGKTAVTDGEFDTLNLSTGQRKRIALMVSLLERRQILLLDEWAAEQDPESRRRFYDELLPELHRAGLTIVLVTHDDRYIGRLDQIGRGLRMQDGRFVAKPIPREETAS